MSAPHVLVVRYEHLTHSPEHFDASVENPSGTFDDAFFFLFLWTSNLQPNDVDRVSQVSQNMT